MTKKVLITLLIVVAIIAVVTISIANKGEKSHSKPADHPKQFKEEISSSFRPNYHFSTPKEWKNDPQKPIYFDGKYHYYYLYNGDYSKKGGGTEWRHATSEDLVTWKDEGVAIPKFTNDNGDIWSGSVVEDKENTAGFGKGTIIALVTQPSADSGKQEQYLWYSTDRGKTFKAYEKPVLPNPGVEDFRDPKVVWDDQHNKWVMLMSEGAKIGFYESDNLKYWTYTGGFQTNDIGITECPDLFRMRGDDGTEKWVLGASANGKESGQPNTYAYWTGDFDGKEFTPDNDDPKWLDHGLDWYGGVTFDDGEQDDKLEKRYALAWMNNWDYPDNTPTVKEGFNGVDSIVRELRLKKQDDQYVITSSPIEKLQDFVSSKNDIGDVEVDGSKTLDVKGDSYQIQADISFEEAKNVGLCLRESDDQKRHLDVGVSKEGNYSYVNRGQTDQPDDAKKYVESQAPFPKDKKDVHLNIFVDKTSVEVFVDDGKIVHSQEVFPPLNDQNITLFSDGGAATFKNVTIHHFKNVNDEKTGKGE
ncbi:glycoside hydrolase family 32 protein [Priestia koreensis]|uniref:Levanase n=1 Tax=Priestia koreensis TaxID=284581 RepID=A0A0M0L5H0_9BACI|nr:glycoside hydrolase family 32 protein [Priestia koreensis]KOO46107.1 levanase [Priestia koreensis]